MGLIDEIDMGLPPFRHLAMGLGGGQRFAPATLAPMPRRSCAPLRASSIYERGDGFGRGCAQADQLDERDDADQRRHSGRHRALWAPAAAAGWAIGGLFALGETITHILEGLLVLAALTGLYYFLRAALAHEPIAAPAPR